MAEERRKAGQARQKKQRSKESEQQAAMRQELEPAEVGRNEYELLGQAWEEETALGGDAAERMEQLQSYNYFDRASILNSMRISRNTYKRGEDLIKRGDLQIMQMSHGFDSNSEEILGQMDAAGKEGGKRYGLRMVFSRTEVMHLACECPRCRQDYYSWHVKQTSCPYKAGVLLLLEQYLKEHNFGDATDAAGQSLIAAYQEKQISQAAADLQKEAQFLRLVPRLIKKNQTLSVSFKIGTNRLFVIKKLGEFCRNVKEAATDLYGTNTRINHNPENFTDQGRAWIRYINQVIREEEEFQQRVQESGRYYSYRKTSIGGELHLFGWRLDEFYSRMGDTEVEYEDRDAVEKKKGILTRAENNPKVTMHISEDVLDDGAEFHGIQVAGSLPDLFFGTDTGYYIDDSHLNQVDAGFLEKIEPLSQLSRYGKFSFHVGRNHLADFYYRILPKLSDVAEVTEENAEKFRSYLPPQAHFVFYLDIQDGDAVCGVYARYGEKEVCALDVLRQESQVEAFRDRSREEEVVYLTAQWFPQLDWRYRRLQCGKEEALIYQVMEQGTQRLMELGEVRCTKRFLQHHVVRPVQVSVGVSVSSGLLELELTTEGCSGQELLEILASYREKKKYYRMKDGAFVSLEDPSLEMLSELAEAAHLKPKELIAGKMHLPMYRTLYLDKMLEENESVYSSRDSHFREVVKGFKTVKDADFEEPKSLARIMRGYQKNGYKWLRTLEQWQFGGILADDMGLGKTLQAIAVLLSAKEEGTKGTSLVVAPASLVYNWGEEFARFAPKLSTVLIVGTQEERREKIEAYREADVLVTSYDLLKRDIAFYEGKEFHYEIIDEAQYIKNHMTAAAKAVKVIKSQVRYALTGTPIENRLSELWSIFDYLMPGFLYGYDVFKRDLETPIVKNEDQAAMKRLQKMTAPFILRRCKEEVLRDLPEKLEECRYVRFEGTQQKLYDGQVLRMREQIAAQDDEQFNKNKMLILAELTRLRQICCDPALCFEDYQGEAAKREACLDLVQSAIDGGHRMLLFSQFTTMLELLQKSLDQLGISYYVITGSTTKERRLQLVKQFNEGNVPVFLISLKAGGVGLNLTGADMVIHYDPWWNLAVQNQATDRVHRIGQTKKVTVYKLIAKNTIEEKIQKLQDKKKDLADQIIGGQTGQLGSLNKEEILQLLEVS